MIGYKIDQHELNTIMKRFRKYNKKQQEAIDNEIKKSAVRITTKAKRYSPVRTGRLRASLHWLIKGKNTNYRYRDNEGNTFTGELGVQVKEGAIVGTNVHYAERVETREVNTETGRQPFLQPAYLEDIPKLLRGIKKVFKDAGSKQ